MICSKNKLDFELDTTKQLLIDNGYPDDVLVSCITEKITNISSEKQFGPESARFTSNCPRLEMFHHNLKTKLIKSLHLASTSMLRSPLRFIILGLCYHLLKKDSVLTTQKKLCSLRIFAPM